MKERTLYLPEKIRKRIGNRTYQVDQIGLSDSQVICFDDMVLKIERKWSESDREHQLMKWLYNKVPVPKTLCHVTEHNTNYLLMEKVQGTMSYSDQWFEDPYRLVRLLAEGLKILWSVDISDCPFDSSLDQKLKQAKVQIDEKLFNPNNTDSETFGEDGFHSPEELLDWLEKNRPNEDLVLSHGDYCLPNVFLQDDRVSGFIDLGRGGIADRYQDIALCYRSLKHNYERYQKRSKKSYRESNPEGCAERSFMDRWICGSNEQKVPSGKNFSMEQLFIELQIEPDWEKIHYYILLDELF